MKKLLLISLSVVLFAATAYSQTIDIVTLKTKFDNLATDMAASLPMNSSIGLNWGDPYIGQLFDLPPHFGIGLTAGATTIPYDSFKAVIDRLGGDASEFSQFAGIGVPIPGWALDGRVGGIILPFDFGIKIGFIPDQLKDKLSKNVQIDYTLIGFDVRVPMLKQFLIIPEISVGGGFNYMKGNVAVKQVFGSNTAVSVAGLGLGYNYLVFNAPDLTLDWESRTLDLKAQLGWNLLILDLGLGAAVSYGNSTVKGGLKSTVTKSNMTSGGTQLTAGEKAALAALGYPVTDTGVSFGGDKSGAAFRIMANFGISILILKVELGGMYNPVSKTMGATVGARIQL
jgi:hypothetical protein